MAILARFTRPVIYLNAVIVTVVAAIIFFLHAAPLTKAEPILSTRVGDLYLAFAVLLLLVAGAYSGDRRWILIPILINLAEFLNNVIQLAIRLIGANIPTDPQLAPPLMLTGIFLLYYVLVYPALRRPGG